MGTAVSMPNSIYHWAMLWEVFVCTDLQLRKFCAGIWGYLHGICCPIRVWSVLSFFTILESIACDFHIYFSMSDRLSSNFMNILVCVLISNLRRRIFVNWKGKRIWWFIKNIRLEHKFQCRHIIIIYGHHPIFTTDFLDNDKWPLSD